MKIQHVIAKRDPVAFGMSQLIGPFDTPEEAYEYNTRHLPFGQPGDDGYIYLMVMKTPEL